MTEQTIRLRVTTGDTLSLAYFSTTYDVIVIRGMDDEAHALIVASFVKRDDAHAFARTCGEYVVFVRPPHTGLYDALDVLRMFLALQSDEGLPITRHLT
jgi:hypothetical protein